MRPYLLVLLLAVGLSSARWVREGRTRSAGATIVGQATSELSTAIFQGYIDDDSNIAFSPLGYSAILAMLAEGAKGDTREQLVTALHLPTDNNLTRKTYKSILEMVPLKNFFYVYKNYTIHDDYKKILEDYYLTDVRSVERVQSTIDDDDDDDEAEPAKPEFTVDIPEKKPEDKIDDIPEMMPPKPSEEKLISFAVEDIPEKVDVSEDEYKPAKNIKEKIKLVKTYPKKESSVDEEETMVAVEARNHARSLKVLQGKKDISSSLSVNSFGKKTSNKSVSDSLMIIFNGMYFRGSWKHPFTAVEPGVFYKSSSEKKQVPLMKAKGSFKTAYVAALDSEAVLLPYDSGRFALLVVVPRSRDGLTRLIADLPAAPLADIHDMLKEEDIQLCMPVFYVETTTKPISALAKFGVTKIFSRDADLSGVSSDEGLFVQEMVQHVAVRVDNTDSSTAQLTSSNTVSESTKNLPLSQEKLGRRFSVEHPFIFFVIDQLDNLVVAAGKINDPKQPTPFEMKTREFF